MFGCQYKYVTQKPYPQQADKERDPGFSQPDKSALLNHTDTKADYGVGINVQRLICYSQNRCISGKQYRKFR